MQDGGGPPSPLNRDHIGNSKPLYGIDARDHCTNIGATNSDVIKLGLTYPGEFLVGLMPSTSLDVPVNKDLQRAANDTDDFADHGVGIRAALVLGMDD